MFLTEYDEDVVHKAFYNVGVEEGEARGIAEANRKTAMSLLADGMSVESVSKHTSLPIEEVKKLKMV